MMSIAAPGLLVMGADSTVKIEFSDRTEYDTGRKVFEVGDCLVGTWGVRDGNTIGQSLAALAGRSPQPVVSDVATEVHRYHTTEYQPKSYGFSNVGYHIGGLEGGQPRLFHSFWEPPGYQPSTPPGGCYGLNDHTPGSRGHMFLYNGRNELAHTVVEALLSEVRSGKPVFFNLPTVSGCWRLVHFVLRTVSELTPDVGPPFVLHARTADGRRHRQRYDIVAPIPPREIETVFGE